MKFSLLRFQQDVVGDAIRNVRLSMNEVAQVGGAAGGQVVTLIAPTGAGKTVMAAAVLEALFAGDADQVGEDRLTVVWLSDLPKVNEQTARRLSAASSELDSRLIDLDNDFSGAELSPGRIYFLNTQKLAANAGLVNDGEARPYTIWEILNRTVARDPAKFILVIDEAHRGMERGSAADGASTIVQRFILGSENLNPIPIIVGLSATPTRFTELLQNDTRRVVRRTEADVPEVRKSGLIKDRVVVWRPEDSLTHSEHTLLQRAAQELQDFTLRWRTYSERQGLAKTVEPVLVVQVEDRTSDSISATDIESAIQAIEEVIGAQHPDAFAHSFGDAPTGIGIGGSRRLRYINASDIDADPLVRVVFFKTSLVTGWDCPRAEVMMSYRTAEDPTSIAQLVGRMVRTPLARRVSEDDVLNSVSLYLPKYNRAAVQDIVKRLKAGDPDSFPAIDADEGAEVVTCERDERLYSRIEERAALLRTYIVPRPRRMPPVQRVERLAGSLSDFDLLPTAPTEIEDKLLDLLWGQLESLRQDPEFQAALADSRKIGLNAVTLTYLTGLTADTSIQIESTSTSLERLFDQVGARTGAGLHLKLWRRIRLADRMKSSDEAHVEVIAVLRHPDSAAALEQCAREIYETWMSAYAEAFDGLSEDAQEEIDRLREEADAPSAHRIQLPANVTARRTTRSTDWPKNLYRDPQGYFPDRLNEWEEGVLEAEIARTDLICWVRNTPRKRWAVAYPYDKTPSEKAAAYPDFVFYRSAGDDVRADLVDPHGIHLPDAPAKARGFAAYAKLHGATFDRIEMVIYDEQSKRKRTLNLKSIAVRDQVGKVTTREHLQALFDIVGS
ncbi:MULTISPECIES: DEAD/DEAH box helicase [Microbacterium]|uniref:DEAD/DEAH box helicase n=1 Tax=Microbacterium TaxID=33882 RepID=UPI0027827CA3|nr:MULTISPECIES: DEAD/DEAH box helicase family protein [Microbacterium]MDQ1075039.1 type III restriction enzyme [Microbacterium sp. SORGH_AS_0969]MDQ1115270.1 type III restriction enzyme [Microbacterium testaceum]